MYFLIFPKISALSKKLALVQNQSEKVGKFYTIRRSICSKRAKSPFSIIFSTTCTCYFKGVKRRYYGVKGSLESGKGRGVSATKT